MCSEKIECAQKIANHSNVNNQHDWMNLLDTR